MKAKWQGWLFRWLAQTKAVPIAECVHYGAFRYGCGDVNPYEDYATALVRREPLVLARERFVDFLCHYRPRDFGEALGVELGGRHELWHFPWEAETPAAAWVAEPDDAPDIITHFSERGILRFRIEEEFLWAEKLFHSIGRHGFRAKAGERPIEAREFWAAGGAKRYLITDGNHRVSALAAIGKKTVVVRSAPWAAVRETACTEWPRVRDGSCTAEDALRIFRAYFNGNHRTRTTEVPATVLESDGATWS